MLIIPPHRIRLKHLHSMHCYKQTCHRKCAAMYRIFNYLTIIGLVVVAVRADSWYDDLMRVAETGESTKKPPATTSELPDKQVPINRVPIPYYAQPRSIPLRDPLCTEENEVPNSVYGEYLRCRDAKSNYEFDLAMDDYARVLMEAFALSKGLYEHAHTLSSYFARDKEVYRHAYDVFQSYFRDSQDTEAIVAALQVEYVKIRDAHTNCVFDPAMRDYGRLLCNMAYIHLQGIPVESGMFHPLIDKMVRYVRTHIDQVTSKLDRIDRMSSYAKEYSDRLADGVAALQDIVDKTDIDIDTSLHRDIFSTAEVRKQPSTPIVEQKLSADEELAMIHRATMEWRMGDPALHEAANAWLARNPAKEDL